jgi:calcium/calmodulin-dependent 3',5'-cyclic nucleotide phosphodiesterase
MFLINSKNPLAIVYNDKSVLENHHISYTFRLLSEPNCEIFENLNNTELKDIRKKMINMVLSTDLAVHFYELGNFKAKTRSIGIYLLILS